MFFVLFLSECAEGSWGVGCLETCHCASGSRCNKRTGECLCAPGKAGVTCEEGKIVDFKREDFYVFVILFF